MTLLDIFAVSFGGMIASIMYFNALNKVRARSARSQAPRKNVTDLKVVCVVVRETTFGQKYDSAHRNALCDRLEERGGTAVLLPPSLVPIFTDDSETVRLPPPDIDLTILVSYLQEDVEITTAGYAPAFKAWVRQEYPKAIDRRGEFTDTTLLRQYHAVMETVVSKYARATNLTPYTFTRTSGSVRYFICDGTLIQTMSFSDVTMLPDVFWKWLMDRTLDGITVRTRKGSRELRVGKGQWIQLRSLPQRSDTSPASPPHALARERR
ncbi:MAG: hypothetical protein AAB416_01655 [Patescibacteria group bacterium]